MSDARTGRALAPRSRPYGHAPAAGGPDAPVGPYPPLHARRPPTLFEKRPGQWTLRFRYAGRTRDVLVMGETDPALRPTPQGQPPRTVTDRAAKVFTGPYLRGEYSPFETDEGDAPEVARARATVEASVEAFLARYDDSPATQRNYRSVLRRFERTLPPHTWLVEVEPGDVAAFVADGPSPSTRLHAWVHLRAFFNAAVKSGDVARNVVEDVPRPRADGRSLPFAMPSVLSVILDAAQHAEPPHIADAVAFAAATGLRRGELVAAQLGDVDLGAGTVTVRAKSEARDGVDFRPKGRRDRSVQLTPLAVRIAERAASRVSERPGADERFPLFGPGTRWRDPEQEADARASGRPRPISTSNLTRAVTRARVAATSGWEGTPGVSGVPSRLNLHGLRGHYITYLLLLGWPVPLVQSLAGHADSATTLGYWRDAAGLTAGAARSRFRTEALALGFEEYGPGV